MENQRATRKQIHIISRYSNWHAAGIKRTLREEGIYADKAKWAKFIDVALLGLGIAFAVAGIIFFFAFNWHNLHKFAKLGIVQGLVITGVLVSLFANLKPVVKKLILTGVSFLVGLLFAVFGQIYQTGAGTYDFFLGWSVFIFIWAIVAEFAPLWLVLTLLINTTIVLYSEQVGPSWSATTLCLILFALNVAIIALAQWFYRNYADKVPVILFSKIVALAAAGCITISIVSGISVNYYQATPDTLWPALLSMVLVYGFAANYSVRNKSLYYLCIIPLSIIIIITSWIMNLFREDSGGTFFLIAIFVVFSITVLVNTLITLNKTWHANQ
ncbi:DUF2157 domain-containing protein [Mucilaginibacter psychrotolerans]|uniref:DUF2157 domain-containing protein n=1 Tax=Mucilaginibacter psychrotolerans TaxID=1524096 RepID=A0A4Y8SGY7_9SPHI|nr:DUF2157 domain-containing protein [Mucilaginibacter psychrotolerans]TFF38198.1 DUF2157 domain-containing protein [Mucilaginibacter psychrotolerans]